MEAVYCFPWCSHMRKSGSDGHSSIFNNAEDINNIPSPGRKEFTFLSKQLD